MLIPDFTHHYMLFTKANITIIILTLKGLSKPFTLNTDVQFFYFCFYYSYEKHLKLCGLLWKGVLCGVVFLSTWTSDYREQDIIKPWGCNLLTWVNK